MGDISAGEVWIDGQTVNAARLNNDLASAVVQPTFYTSKSVGTPVAGDTVIFVRASDGLFYKTTIATLQAAGGVTSVGLTAPAGFTVGGSPVSGGAGVLVLGLSAQSGNKMLVSPADGSSGVPVFRACAPLDIVFPTVTIAAFTIDWSLSNSFYKQLSANTSFIFTNYEDGAQIRVRIQSGAPGGFHAAFPSLVKWAGGVQPVSSNGLDKWTFTVMGTDVLGEVSQNMS